MHITPKIPFWSAVVGSFSGVYSHVMLDSVMHADMLPFSPFSEENGLYHVISVLSLHVFCLIVGVVGVVWLLHLVQIDAFKK